MIWKEYKEKESKEERGGPHVYLIISFGPLKELTSRRRWQRRQQQFDKRIVSTHCVLLKCRCSMINGIQIINWM